MSIEEVIAALRGCAELRPPATADALRDAEIRFHGRLSDDVKAFYSAADGTVDETAPEQGWTRFWELAAWTPVARRLPGAEYRGVHELPVVADHCHESWWYALDVRVGAPAYGSVYIVDGLRPPRMVAASFAAFVAAVLRDDESIYPDVTLDRVAEFQ